MRCANTDTLACTYEQVSATMPSVTSANISGSTVVFIGTDFKTTGFSGLASFNGISASAVNVDSNTQATATWALGVPIVASTTKPELRFKQDDSKVVYNANMLAEFSNIFALTSTTQGLTCSYAGGCEYEVVANGLATMLKEMPNSNYLSFCEEKCIFDEKSSTASLMKCKLPKVSTLYSDTTHSIQKSHLLKGMTVTASN